MQCRICNSDNIKGLCTIENYPMASGPVVKIGSPKIKSGNVSAAFCLDCGTCTLVEPNPDDIDYDESYTSSNMAVGLGAKIDDKMEKFINYIGRIPSQVAPRKLLEIGCYDGSLMTELRNRFSFEVWGCEPCHVANIAIKRYKWRVKKDYFSPDLYKKNFFDVVVFRNVLEHISFPGKFLSDVHKVLSQDGWVVLGVPDGEYRIKNGMIGTIVPEHSVYFGEESLRALLLASGFESISIRAYKGGLEARAKKSEKNNITNRDKRNIIDVYKSLRLGVEKSIKVHKKINSLIENSYNIYIFGANTGTLEIFSVNSISPNSVIYVVDDDPLKWGKEIVNFGVPVVDRDFITAIEGNKTVLICSYYFHEKLFNFLNKELKVPFKIIRLTPEVEVVECEKL